jgi:hypothetical protein
MQNAALQIVKIADTYNSHQALKGYTPGVQVLRESFKQIEKFLLSAYCKLLPRI